ncbi:class I SAM-dependent methyltransferase [Cyclobacterium amurskyense]|uniref:Methyltransferase type 12 n=1 Tax=Cyclobacterium amurskyense TaxID=320787 RepID=A0A0H4P9J5_9BACT|nr:class I SAM-dependent methyltransferase [Cyclobacterium amurskyense]AKP51151.1 Methyltransferase type 12 [Cyclobacterium amurskyense]|tara:strand:+ start:8251 stop:9138 length:888 start_codon:yes stop_codon:yes gene_type:complete
MYERLTKCPLCKSEQFINHLVVKDHAISKESFIICECQNCNIWFTNPRPNEENIAKYYDKPSYISHQDKSKNLTDIVYKAVRKYTLSQKLNWVNSRQSSKGRILDYGCGIGLFVKTCSEDGWKAFGMEPNEKAATFAVKNIGINIIPRLKDLEKEKKFDVITLFHVLEHVHKLNETIDILLSRLKKRGLLFIAVPNRDSLDAKSFKENWAALDVPRHLYHFNSSSMEYLSDKHNCRIVDTIPMKFDSYYVSLLSHQYLGSKNIYIEAIKSGYKSNQQAKLNGNNYSSLLFVIKKK